jgi:hypothetical protein
VTKTEEYLRQIFDKRYSKYEKLILKAVENGLIVKKNSNFQAIHAVFEAIYDKYVVRYMPEKEFYCSKYKIKKSAFDRYFRKLENVLVDYLNQMDRVIKRYTALFDYSMKMIALTSDREYVKIDDFLKATFNFVDVFGNINRDEARRFFCSYFYLLGFEAKKGRVSANSYKLYITPEKTNLFLNIKVRRGNNVEE